MSRYSQYKDLLINLKTCPDGNTIPCCASCAADALAQLDANKCWYCHRNRITRGLKLYFDTHDLLHLVCNNCAEALDGEKCTFIKLEDQI